MSNSNEIKVNFEDYLKYLKKKWGYVILVGVICTIGLGGYVLLKSFISWDATLEAHYKAVDEYNDEYEEYEEKLSAVTYGQALNEEKLEHIREYMTKSIKVGLNPYSILTVKTNIVLESGKKNTATAGDAMTGDETEQKKVLKTYYDNLYAYADWDAVGAFFNGTEARYVKEVVECNIDYDGMSIELRVMLPYEDYATSISDMLIDNADKMTDTKGYDVTVSSRQTEYVIDAELDEYISDKWEEYETLDNKVRYGNDAIENIEEPAGVNGDDVSRKHIVIKAIIYGIIGLIFGCLLVVIILYEIYVHKGIIYTAEEFSRITGVKSFDFTDKDLDDKKSYERIKMYLESKKDISDIAVLGNYDDSDAMIVNSLKESADTKVFKLINDVKADETLKVLYESDALMLIAERGKLMIRDMVEIKKVVEESGNEIVGIIVI